MGDTVQDTIDDILKALKERFKDSSLGPWEFEATHVDDRFLDPAVAARLKVDVLRLRKSPVVGTPHAFVAFKGTYNPKNKYGVRPNAIGVHPSAVINAGGGIYMVKGNRYAIQTVLDASDFADMQADWIDSASTSAIKDVGWRRQMDEDMEAAKQQREQQERVQREEAEAAMKAEKERADRNAENVKKNIEDLRSKATANLKKLNKDVAKLTGPWSLVFDVQGTTVTIGVAPSPTKASKYGLKPSVFTYTATDTDFTFMQEQGNVTPGGEYYTTGHKLVRRPGSEIAGVFAQRVNISEDDVQKRVTEEEAANKEPAKGEDVAPGVMSALNRACRKLGWQTESAEMDGAKGVRAGYRSSNLPKEGAREMGEADYDELLESELAKGKKVVDNALSPYMDGIKEMYLQPEEKSWITVYVELK